MYCSNTPETTFHLFCECPKILPLWQKLFELINQKTKKVLTFSSLDMLFGTDVSQELNSCINFLFLCLKFYIYRCRFQGSNLDFQHFFLALVKCKEKSEYLIAQNRGKLSSHLKKWSWFTGEWEPFWYSNILFNSYYYTGNMNPYYSNIIFLENVKKWVQMNEYVYALVNKVLI